MTIKTKAPLRILCDGMKGENYWLNGCMAYLAACLRLHEKYNYQFFNCYSGDSVTQVFSKDPTKDVWSYSHECTDEALKRCFHAIGYGYTYVSSIREPEECLPMIRESLERGLPVFARGGGSTDGQKIEFNCIVGYDDDALYYLFCDEDQATKVTEYDFRELVFVGKKTAEPIPLGEGYLEALHRVPALLNRPATDEFSFGIQAFSDWAEQLANGSLSHVPAEKLTVWGIHGTYLCMLGSNGSGFGLYDKVFGFYPDMTWLGEVKKHYDELSEIFHTLAYRNSGLCGGFDMTLEDARNPDKMRPVCEQIRRAAEVTGQVAEIIRKNTVSK